MQFPNKKFGFQLGLEFPKLIVTVFSW
jgi:hypothetical protein